MTAPYCDLPSSYKIPQPAARPYPPIPVAHDLRSAINAINAIRNLLDYLLNHLPKNNKDASNSAKVGNFTEVQRTTQTVRVFNPDDSSQWVDVEMITSLTMGDKKSGESWTWKR